MKQHVIYVFTHDSIGVGEDGPTHQPVEHVAALRTIPNVMVLRPCDANETALAWRVAMEAHHQPVALILSPSSVPTLDQEAITPLQRVCAAAPTSWSMLQKAKPDIILHGEWVRSSPRP